MELQEAYNRLISRIPREKLLINESMKKHTSFRIGGPADIMLVPSHREEVQYAIQVCREMDIPYFIMGNGTNLLVRDKGIRGLVIKIFEGFREVRVEGNWIFAQAGVLLSVLSKEALKASLTGLEFASGIPGTLGGAVAMNAGAYGGEMKDVVRSVTVLNPNNEFQELRDHELEFDYRSSIIQKGGYVVLDVKMELQKGDYDSSKALIEDLTRRRKEKQPLSLPSAGSTFKRPVGYYAGKLIQDCGLKGMRVGDAQVSELHSGFIVNLGNATCEDVVQLIEKVRERVKENFGVELQPEVKIIGEK